MADKDDVVPENKEETPAVEPEQDNPQAEGGDWYNFERHMRERDDAFLSTLNPAATDQEIAEAEKSLGVKLPADYVKLLKIHNGQNEDAKPLFGRYAFSPLSEVIAAAAEQKGNEDTKKDEDILADEGVSPVFWSDGWIPFAIAPGGDALVIDSAPPENGSTGQVISFYVNDKKREVVSSDFGKWLGDFITDELGEVKPAPNAAMEGWFGKSKPKETFADFHEFEGERSKETVMQLIQKYEKWLKENNQSLVSSMAPPASSSEIAAAEKALEAKLPADYLALLKVHNGQTAFKAHYFYPFNFLGISDVESTLKQRSDPDQDFINKVNAPAGVKQTSWDPKWVMIGAGQVGEVYIDLAPESGGKVGQVLLVEHGGDGVRLINSSFRDFFHDSIARAVSKNAMEGWFGGKTEESKDSGPPDVKKDLDRLMAFYKSKGKEIVLRDPATPDLIAKGERILKVKLPTDFITLLKIGNGQKSGPALFGGFDFIAVQEIVELQKSSLEMLDDYKENDERANPDKGVKKVWRSPLWIGFAEDGSGDDLCFDFDPAPEGTKGQIVQFLHDSGGRKLRGSSFSEFFHDFVNKTVSGK